MPRFSKQFESLAEEYIGWAIHQAMLFVGTVPPADWTYDLSARTFTVGGRTLPMAALGTSLPGPGVLAWCWADRSLEGFPELLQTSLRLRQFGTEHGIPEFTTGGVEVGGWESLHAAAEPISLVAMGVLGARGYAGFPMHHGGSFYVLTDDPSLPAPQEPEPDRLQAVLRRAAGYFPDADQFSVAAGYAQALGGTCTQIPGGLNVRFAGGGMSLHYQGSELSWVGPSMG